MSNTEDGKLVDWLNQLASKVEAGKTVRPCAKALRRTATALSTARTTAFREAAEVARTRAAEMRAMPRYGDGDDSILRGAENVLNNIASTIDAKAKEG